MIDRTTALPVDAATAGDDSSVVNPVGFDAKSSRHDNVHKLPIGIAQAIGDAIRGESLSIYEVEVYAGDGNPVTPMTVAVASDGPDSAAENAIKYCKGNTEFSYLVHDKATLSFGKDDIGKVISAVNHGDSAIVQGYFKDFTRLACEHKGNSVWVIANVETNPNVVATLLIKDLYTKCHDELNAAIEYLEDSGSRLKL